MQRRRRWLSSGALGSGAVSAAHWGGGMGAVASVNCMGSSPCMVYVCPGRQLGFASTLLVLRVFPGVDTGEDLGEVGRFGKGVLGLVTLGGAMEALSTLGVEHWGLSTGVFGGGAGGNDSISQMPPTLGCPTQASQGIGINGSGGGSSRCSSYSLSTLSMVLQSAFKISLARHAKGPNLAQVCSRAKTAR